MSKRITILGSTGSIGRQSLEVISACGMEAVALTANSSVKLLEEQARRYRPELAVLMDERAAGDLRVKLADTNVRVLGGMEGILEAASLSSADTVITAVVGMIGLRPTPGRDSGGEANRSGQQRNAGMCRPACTGGGSGLWGPDHTCGFRALRPFPMPGGQQGQGRGQTADPHLLRRTFLWQKKG